MAHVRNEHEKKSSSDVFVCYIVIQLTRHLRRQQNAQASLSRPPGDDDDDDDVEGPASLLNGSLAFPSAQAFPYAPTSKSHPSNPYRSKSLYCRSHVPNMMLLDGQSRSVSQAVGRGKKNWSIATLFFHFFLFKSSF